MATDVLARGIDVTGVDHVINYDLPDMPEDYVHRIGRTGRAGEAGYAISFVSPDTRRLLRDVEHLINREIPFMELESYELDPSILKQGGKGQGAGKSKRSGGYAGKRSGSYAGKSSGSYAGKSSGGYRGGKGAGGYGGSKNASRTGGKREGGYAGKANELCWQARGRLCRRRTPAAAQEAAAEGASFEGSARTQLPRARAKQGAGYRRASAPKAQKYAGKRFERFRGMPASARTPQATTAVPRAEEPYGEGRGKRADKPARAATRAARARPASTRRTVPASITDVRSFGEHKKRARSKRAALEME